MNRNDTRNNMIKAWLKYNYSDMAMKWHLENAYTETFDDFPFFARSWKGESDIE